MRKNRKKDKKKPLIPLFAKILLSFALVSLIIFEIAKRNVRFADWMTLNPGYALRRALAFVSNAVPFSLGEAIVLLAPIIIIAVIVIAAKRNTARARIRFLSGFLAVLSLFYSLYVLMLGVGYHRTPIASQLGIEQTEVTADSLEHAMRSIMSECEGLLDGIDFEESGSSVANTDFDTMCDDIISSYDRLQEDHPSLEIKNFDSRAKEILISRVMTSFEISGVYTFFTGESNINVHYPDYVIPYTMAHELAHQRGIARENEANFIAFLVCIRADDPYIRYSAYMNMFEYLGSALSRTDKERFREVYAAADPRMTGESRAFNEFYYAHKNELMSKISDFMNDHYLKASGTEGIVSYGLVVRLCVAYYADKNA